MRRHPRFIPRAQVVMVAIYVALIAIPPWLPGVGAAAGFVGIARFAIWAVWWPFVLLSLIPFGRAWCGVLCPEGALAEAASRFAAQRPVPRWMTWGGLPLLTFIAITSVGQLVEVDERPLPQLLVLGGSTLMAIATSLAFSRHTRVWCRCLCPVSMLFGVFSRLGAAAFHVDRGRLERERDENPARKGKCPVLIHLPAMSTARDCLMCFACSGWRDAIHLRFRRPGREVERIGEAQPSPWEICFLFAGAIGLPLGVFFAERFELGGLRLLGSLLSGATLALFALAALTTLAARALDGAGASRWRATAVELGYLYAPVALFSLFLGLSQPTFEAAAAVGLPTSIGQGVRLLLLIAGATWSCFVAYRLLRRRGARGVRLLAAALPCLLGPWLVVAGWAVVLD